MTRLWWVKHQSRLMLRVLRLRLIDWLVWRVLPRDVVLHCAIRVGVHATTGKWSNEIVPNVTMVTCLERWDEDATS